MAEEVLDMETHSKLHVVEVRDGVKIINHIFPRVKSQDVDVMEEASHFNEELKANDPNDTAEIYTLSDVLNRIGKIAFRENLTRDDFAEGVVTDRIDSEDPTQLVSAVALNKIRTQLFNINNSDGGGLISIFAPQTSGKGVPSYNPETKEWTWVPITGTSEIIGNKITLNGNGVTSTSGLTIFTADQEPSVTTTPDSYRYIMMYNGKGQPLIWKSLAEFLRLNGGTNTVCNDPIYAPTTSGTAGMILVSNGPNVAPSWVENSQATITINGQEIDSEVSIYAPETSGQTGNILVSSGEGNPPVWQHVEFNSDGTIAIKMDSEPTPNSENAVTSGGTWSAINNAPVKINGKSATFQTMQSQNIVTPDTTGNSGQQLVSQGSSAPVWKNKGSYFTSGYINTGATSISVAITVPTITSSDRICVKAGIDSVHSLFYASRMDEYSDAGAYISSVSAPNNSTTVTVVVRLRNAISYPYPFNVEVVFS